MKTRILLPLFVLGLSIVFTVSVSAQTKVNIRFARGASSATVHGTVTGYKYVDYVVGARGGQTMSVHLQSASQWAQFVVFDPAMENVEGSLGDTDWSGELPSNGKYTIRVMLPRAEARRKGSMANYSVRITIN